MYAVIRAGSRQFRVAPGDVIKISKTAAHASGKVQFSAGDVLAISPEPGQITLPNGGATVTGQVIGDGRGEKVLVFKFKRKKQYKRMQGHRQDFTEVRITEIAFGGKKASAPEVQKSKRAEVREKNASEAAAVAEKSTKPAVHAKHTVAKKPAAKKKAAAKKPIAKAKTAAKKK